MNHERFYLSYTTKLFKFNDRIVMLRYSHNYSIEVLQDDNTWQSIYSTPGFNLIDCIVFDNKLYIVEQKSGKHYISVRCSSDMQTWTIMNNVELTNAFYDFANLHIAATNDQLMLYYTFTKSKNWTEVNSTNIIWLYNKGDSKFEQVYSTVSRFTSNVKLLGTKFGFFAITQTVPNLILKFDNVRTSGSGKACEKIGNEWKWNKLMCVYGVLYDIIEHDNKVIVSGSINMGITGVLFYTEDGKHFNILSEFGEFPTVRHMCSYRSKLHFITQVSYQGVFKTVIVEFEDRYNYNIFRSANDVESINGMLLMLVVDAKIVLSDFRNTIVLTE